ncbi:YcgN family cysteine cluster protein [Ostreibacterium oceani]|uniref:YcgN family cysteine cluster protein n=1 Tax=Ostreibacterium oceani TaxID=2654998 RepID=A0A6N7ER99_9GAMM|nr:YcgN family cysteine cluster protein [Ostreibacterium oceani]MPV85394.1 YcgN family cysteine cluster protein [Ostreibacterium oceani]
MQQRSKTFWNTTPLNVLSEAEWEALCDGCGKCCLHKLEDEDDATVYYTDVACHLLDLQQCRCSDYANRHINVPDCIAFNYDDIPNMPWLPDTCAYRLRYYGEPLYDWHYLISGDRQTVHQANESIRDFAVLDSGQDLVEHVLHFKP